MDRVGTASGGDATAVPSLSLAQRRECVAAAVAALKDVSLVIHQAASGDLTSVVGEFDQLRSLAEAGLIVATAEAEQRGVIEGSQCASTAAWVRDAAWHLQTCGSAAVAKCVAILRRHDLGSVADAIRSTDVTPTRRRHCGRRIGQTLPPAARPYPRQGAGSDD